MEPDQSLRDLLLRLLEQLEAIGVDHEELYDTEVRERMSSAVFSAFVNAEPGFEFPASFGMFGKEEDGRVRSALLEYVERARVRAEQLGLDAAARLAAFQDEDVVTKNERQYPDDFFGWSDEP